MKHGRARKKAPEAGYYDRIFRTHSHFNRHYSKSRYLPVWRALVEQISRDANILEVGCGPGQLAALLRDEGFSSYQGFDFSTSAIARARKAVPDFDFRVADARDPASFDGTYDTVIATEVLEHLDDDLAVIGLLSPGIAVHFTLPRKDDPSHVRYFPTIEGVHARYGDLLDDFIAETVGQWHIAHGRIKERS